MKNEAKVDAKTDLRMRLFEILGPTSAEWCGCMEGDMSDQFLPHRNEVVDKLEALIKELLEAKKP